MKQLKNDIFPKKKFDVIYLWCIFLFCLALAIDLITKGLAEYYIQEGTTIEIFPGFFMKLTLHYNSGMAFSIFNDNPVAMKIITWGSLFVMVFFGYLIYRLPSEYNSCKLLLAVITSGAFGNFLDRVFIAKGVRDFMDVSSIRFGVCNFADYFISFGGVALVIILAWKFFTEADEEERK